MSHTLLCPFCRKELSSCTCGDESPDDTEESISAKLEKARLDLDEYECSEADAKRKEL